MQAYSVLEILPPAEGAELQLAQSDNTALTATVTLTPGMPLAPDLIDRVWEGVQQHANSSKGQNVFKTESTLYESRMS